MRTQRNVTGIAVWLAFLSWMYLVAGMVSPSEVVAQNKKPCNAQKIACAKIWEIPGIISGEIAANPGAVAEIVKRSITVRAEASEIILGAALRAAPEAASQLTGVAVQVLSEQQASEPSPTQMVSQQVDQRRLNNQTIDVSDFDPFNPNAGSELAERILEFTCEGLGPVQRFVNFCVVSPAL
jgi:hypothetical protein